MDPLEVQRGIDMRQARRKCGRCGNFVVHPDRKYALCLDCLIDMMTGPEGMTIKDQYLARNQPQADESGAWHMKLDHFAKIEESE